MDKSGKDIKRIKDRKLKESSESHVELDSRLLSALLTVSLVFLLIYDGTLWTILVLSLRVSHIIIKTPTCQILN